MGTIVARGNKERVDVKPKITMAVKEKEKSTEEDKEFFKSKPPETNKDKDKLTNTKRQRCDANTVGTKIWLVSVQNQGAPSPPPPLHENCKSKSTV